MAATIPIQCSHPQWPAVKRLVRRAVRRALRRGAKATGLKIPVKSVEIAILLSSDAECRELNRRYRGRDYSTNVLSFALNDGEGPMVPLLGELVLAYETIVREAEEQGKTFKDHLRHLVVHGVLHLLGLDHERSPKEAERQEALERTILAELGVADPYA